MKSKQIKIGCFLVGVFVLQSLSADACHDKLAECSSYKDKCYQIAVRKVCPVTCENCPTDPCSVNNGECDHSCNWTGAVVTCSCQPGFRLADDNRSCEDINECTDGPNPCFLGLPAFCVNSVGSYSCQAYHCQEWGNMNYYRSGKCCHAKNNSCGLNPSIRSHIQQPTRKRIFGGLDAAVSAWPWMAQILYRGGPHCGASLISERWLLTAAHCFRFSYEHMIVYLGQTRSAHLTFLDTTRRIERRIARVIVHEDYSGYYNDVALIQLNQPVVFNDIIGPICLPCGEVPNIGDKCWATGFGRTEFSGLESSENLKEVDVPIVSPNKCIRAYAGVQRIDVAMMMCAGYPEGKKDACFGDSGGPLACQRQDSCEWYLSGITSFGRGCALAGYYGVYVNVLNYEDWIQDRLGVDVNSLCRKHYRPCRGLKNIDKDCYSKLYRCDYFPVYMNVKCNLACCQLKNKEIANCEDDPEAASACELYVHECNNPVFNSFMREKCRRTCRLC